MSREVNTPQNNSEDVDLGQLFKLMGNMFDRFFKFLGKLINKLFLAFVWCVFFIKKHIIKLGIAAVLGFVYGLIAENKSQSTYKSSIIIKQNYDIGENLYNNIDYYNQIISQEDFSTLANVLEIDSAHVTSIIKIDVEALVNENQRLLQFSDYTKKIDSAIASTLDYDDYLESVNEYIYDSQQISILSSTNNNFDKVFESIIINLNNNAHFKREQGKDLNQLKNRELAIREALVKSDSLQSTYKKVLENTIIPKGEAQTSITIEGNDEKDKTKEFDLYKNDIQLRNELVGIEREKEDKEFVVEVISSTGNNGYIYSSIEVFEYIVNPKLFYAILLPTVLFLILSMFRFLQFLEKYKRDV